MEITINSQCKKDYLLIETKAVLVTRDDLISQATMLYAEIVKHNTKKILIDETATRFPEDLVLYFDLVRNYDTAFSTDIRELKIAIVVEKEFEENANSWAAMCVSRGLNYWAFTSVSEAERWLLA